MFTDVELQKECMRNQDTFIPNYGRPVDRLRYINLGGKIPELNTYKDQKLDESKMDIGCIRGTT